VAHACNPSYSGGRDQEHGGSKLAWANSLRKNYHKKRLVEWLKVKALASNPSTAKNKTKNKNTLYLLCHKYIVLSSKFWPS
jgi:hypothetical protein